MITIPVFMQYIALITLVIGVVAYIFKTYRDSTTHYDQDTIIRLKESNEVLRQENSDLKTQIAAMEVRLKTLEQANEVMKGIVTGRDTLVEMQKTLNQFVPYIAAFDQFTQHDKMIIDKLDQILAQGAKGVRRKKTT